MVLYRAILIGEEAILSKCCNALVLITFTQSQIGKMNCTSKSCINSLLGFLKANYRSIEMMFEEVEKFFNSVVTEHVTRKFKAKSLLRFCKHKDELEYERGEGQVKNIKPMTDLDLCIEKMKRFYKYFGIKNVIIPD